MLRWSSVVVLFMLAAGVVIAGDEAPTETVAAVAPTPDPGTSPRLLGGLGWDQPPAAGFEDEVRLSIGEILRYPDDPWKERRLSLWNAPLGRTEFQMRHPGPARPWRETVALNLALPGGPVRFVDQGPLGDWYFNDPDPKTKAQLWTAFAVETALPLIDSLFH